MAGNVMVRGAGWHVKDVRRREVHPPALPTMADTGEIDLRRFFRTLWRGKWILLVTMATTMGATTYWLLQATPLYTADVLIVIESRPSSIVKVEEAVQDVSSEPRRSTPRLPFWNREVWPQGSSANSDSRTIRNLPRRILKSPGDRRATVTGQASARRPPR